MKRVYPVNQSFIYSVRPKPFPLNDINIFYELNIRKKKYDIKILINILLRSYKKIQNNNKINARDLRLDHRGM